MVSKRRIQDYALYLFAFSLNFEYWEAFGLKDFFSVGALTGYIYVLTFFLNIRIHFSFKEAKKYIIPILVFFGILSAMSFINDTGQGVKGWFNFSILQCLILFIILNFHFSNRAEDIPLNTLLSFMAGSVFLASLFIMDIGISYSNDNRLSLFENGPNGTGFIFALSIIIILSNAFENRSGFSRSRYYLLLFTPLMLYILTATGSRGSFIAFMLGIASFFIAVYIRKSYKISILIISFLVLIGLFYFGKSAGNLRERFYSTYETGDTSNRIEIWQKVLPLFYENPVLGVGETGYAKYSIKVFHTYKAPHNVFIEILVYTGIVGFSLFVLFIFQIAKKAYMSYNQFYFTLPSSLLVMILAVFIIGHGLYLKLVWLLYAVIIGLATRRNEPGLHHMA